MKRIGFKLRIRPGTEEEYKQRHQAVHEELLNVFRENGITTYSIFMDGTTLFGYMEANDIQATLLEIDKAPANTRWQQHMSDILLADENGQTMHPLEEVFFFQPIL